MQVIDVTGIRSSERGPWNKGKLTGQKPPLQPKHVWAIRTRLQLARRTRDLALFNLAIDSKLRGCDVVSLRSEDVAPHGYAIDRATVRQKKTGRSVRFEITEPTRQAVDEHIKAAQKVRGDFLFSGRRGRDSSLTTRQYARFGVAVDRQHWAQPVAVRHTFVAANESHAHLSADRQPARGPNPPRSHQDREHGEIPWCRGR